MFTRSSGCECVCFLCTCSLAYFFVLVCVHGRVFYSDSWRRSPACRSERTDVLQLWFWFCSANLLTLKPNLKKQGVSVITVQQYIVIEVLNQLVLLLYHFLFVSSLICFVFWSYDLTFAEIFKKESNRIVFLQLSDSSWR